MCTSILVPVDLDQRSSWETAFPVALAMATCFGATLRLANVVPDRGLADPIVMAAHGPGLRDRLLGPNTERAVRRAPCSVLIVRG